MINHHTCIRDEYNGQQDSGDEQTIVVATNSFLPTVVVF